MKKFLLVFLALALVGTFAFAEPVVGGEASISGSVSLTTGYDLDNEGFGFVNDSDIQIVLPILGGDAGAAGDDGIYGEISITDINWQWDLDNDGLYDVDNDESGLGGLDADINATIHFNGFYLGLGEPDFEINNVDVSDDYSVDAYADANLITGGVSLGFKNDMIDISLMVASENDYRGDSDDDFDVEVDDSHASPFNNDIDQDANDDDYEANADGELVFGFAATITPMEGVSVPMSFFFDPKSDAVDFDETLGTGKDTAAQAEDLIAFGMAPSVVMGDLTLDVPVDYVKYGSKSGYELEPAVSYTVMEGVDVAARLLYGSYTDVVAADTEGGMDVENAVSEFSVSVTDTEAFVPGLSWMLEVGLVDMLNYEDTTNPDGYLPLTVDVEASYMTGGMKPYVVIDYDNDVGDMGLDLGVELASDFTGIDNTVITLLYANDALLDFDVYDSDSSDVTEKGRVTLDVTVSF